jgi:hypothetical protein
MTISCDPEEARAIAVSGLALCYALLCMLKRAAVLAPEAIDHTFEAALSSVENAFRPEDEAGALARQLLDLMGRQLATHVNPGREPPDRDGGPVRRPLTATPPSMHRSIGSR